MRRRGGGPVAGRRVRAGGHDEGGVGAGQVVIDVTAADEATANEAATALGGLWLSSGPSTPRRTLADPE
ncbi:DUF6207 family protein [Streptomyces platensis]|uniref:DUF6207 family protein n=1 Tax=Streptomyces platensis TaxID=58346 RepID=UPI002ED1B9ED|nr:DUF6207 family protein [Streptomyces platensis]